MGPIDDVRNKVRCQQCKSREWMSAQRHVADHLPQLERLVIPGDDRKGWRVISLSGLEELHDGRKKPLGDDSIHDQLNLPRADIAPGGR